MAKLGLIAGAGQLPVEIVRACHAAERPVFVVRLTGLADPVLADAPGADIGVAEWGKMFATLRRERCEHICFAGRTPRPDFASLKPDLRGLTALPGIIAAARKGDDALLRQIIREFEREGFIVEGADDIIRGLAISQGPLGRCAPSDGHGADIAHAMRIARSIGALDIGQGVVVVDGLVIAVEAQEGTDAMLRRCAELAEAVGVRSQAATGVLAKVVKPIQDRRVDLPTIGPATVMGAARAGLAGIVGEAGSLLVVDRETVIRIADDLGLFVVGVSPP